MFLVLERPAEGVAGRGTARRTGRSRSWGRRSARARPRKARGVLLGLDRPEGRLESPRSSGRLDGFGRDEVCWLADGLFLGLVHVHLQPTRPSFVIGLAQRPVFRWPFALARFGHGFMPPTRSRAPDPPPAPDAGTTDRTRTGARPATDANAAPDRRHRMHAAPDAGGVLPPRAAKLPRDRVQKDQAVTASHAAEQRTHHARSPRSGSGLAGMRSRASLLTVICRRLHRGVYADGRAPLKDQAYLQSGSPGCTARRQVVARTRRGHGLGSRSGQPRRDRSQCGGHLNSQAATGLSITRTGQPPHPSEVRTRHGLRSARSRDC